MLIERLELRYEKLFSENPGENYRTIDQICEFLRLKNPDSQVIEKYMLPKNQKINYQDIYKKLPNYDELLTEFDKSSSGKKAISLKKQ